MRYALVRNNVVEEVRDSLTEEDIALIGQSYQCIVDVTDFLSPPEVGWTLEGQIFHPPAGTEASVKITRLAFRNRFTMGEKVAMYTASSAPQGIALKVYLDDLASSTYVDLKRADTIAAVNMLAVAGIIAPGRVAEVLSTNVAEEERYRK